MKTLEEVIAWAETKNCKPRREGGFCDHEACARNDEAIAFLKTAVDFAGANSDGKSVTGWLIPRK